MAIVTRERAAEQRVHGVEHRLIGEIVGGAARDEAGAHIGPDPLTQVGHHRFGESSGFAR